LNLQLPLVNSPGGASADRGGTATSDGNSSAGVAVSGNNDNNNNTSGNMEGEIVGGRRSTSSMREEYRLSGLSVSVGEEENEDNEEIDDDENHNQGKTSSSPTPGSPADAFSSPESPATPKSTLNLVHGNGHSGVLGMEMNGVSGGVTRERSSVSVMTSDSIEFAAAANVNSNIHHNNSTNNEIRAVKSPSPKAVDWLPKEKQNGRATGEEYSATTSQAVRMTEDVSENSSFATTATSGDRSSANEPSNMVIAAGGNIIDKQRLLQQINYQSLRGFLSSRHERHEHHDHQRNHNDGSRQSLSHIHNARQHPQRHTKTTKQTPHRSLPAPAASHAHARRGLVSSLLLFHFFLLGLFRRGRRRFLVGICRRGICRRRWGHEGRFQRRWGVVGNDGVG